MRPVRRVDVVVVSYNSRYHLRACVEPLARLDDLHVIVVDNASADDSLEVVADLRVTALQRDSNGGYAAGVNAGWRVGDAPYVLILNPDATIDPAAVCRLVHALEEEPGAGAVAPRILATDGSLAFSQRRFPRVRSTFAQALFLHRLFPHASWSDELVRDERAYGRAASPDWVSGACVLVRRTALQRVGGLDEGFFLYCEDIDLCRRLRNAGYDVRFEPDAVAVHVGGASAPRSTLVPILAESRVRYARKHFGQARAELQRLAIALNAVTHVFLARAGRIRRGHARSLLAIARAGWARPTPTGPPPRSHNPGFKPVEATDAATP